MCGAMQRLAEDTDALLRAKPATTDEIIACAKETLSINRSNADTGRDRTIRDIILQGAEAT